MGRMLAVLHLTRVTEQQGALTRPLRLARPSCPATSTSCAGLLGPVTASAQLQHPSAAARLAAAHALQPAGAGAAASEQLALLQSALRMADSGPLVGHTLQGTFAGCLLGLHG